MKGMKKSAEILMKKMSNPMLLNTDIVYVDECGVDKFMAKECGRAEIGKRVFLPKPGRKFKRISVAVALI